MNKEREITLKRIKKEVDKGTRKWYILRLDKDTKILTDKVVSFYLPNDYNDFDNIATEIEEKKCNNKLFDDLRMAKMEKICTAIDETEENHLFEKQFGKHECLTFSDIADNYGFQKKYFKILPKRNVLYGYYNIDSVGTDNVGKKVPIFTFKHKDGSVLASLLPVVAKW